MLASEAIARVREHVELLRRHAEYARDNGVGVQEAEEQHSAFAALLSERDSLLEVAKHAGQLLDSTTAKHQAEAVHRLEAALAALPEPSE